MKPLCVANALKHVHISPSSSTKRAEMKNSVKSGLYLDLAAEHGKDIFLNATEESMEKYSTPEGSPGKPPPQLHSTPSMAMLSEATLALKESPSALTKMTDISSTGGVYQVRRRSKHVWEETSTESSPASTQSASCFVDDSKLGTKAQNHACTQRSGLGLAMTTDPHKVMPKCVGNKENCGKLPRRLQISRQYSERGGSAPASHRFRREPSKVAVFKPEDEETGADLVEWKVGAPNPEREGMVVGGGARRERAAYVLDKMYGGFSGVPPTALIKVRSNSNEEDEDGHEGDGGNSGVRYKRGSLQKYCPSDGSAEDNPHLVRKASVESAEKIAVLDLRIFNTDRHEGNILVQRVKDKQGQETVKLIPIDHALSLPDWRFLGEALFAWSFWDQSLEPFSLDALELIEKLDVEKDAEALREIAMPEACIATNKLCTLTLKAAAKHGLRPGDLARVFERHYPPGHPRHGDLLSPLEIMITEACRRAGVTYRSKEKDEVTVTNENEKKVEGDLDLTRLRSSWNLSESIGEMNEEKEGVEEDDVGVDAMNDSAAPPTAVFDHFVIVVEEMFSSRRWEELLV